MPVLLIFFFLVVIVVAVIVFVFSLSFCGKNTTEGEVVGWHHQLDEHEFEQALRVGDGQGSLACCSP